MKTIVAPTDFSEISLNAVNYAADMACITGCRLTLLHVYPMPIVISDVPFPVYGNDNTEKYDNERLEKLSSDLLLRTKERIQIYTEAMQGDVVVCINEYCKQVNPYAVVMGEETATGIEQFLNAAAATGAVKQLRWPVIVVPGGAKFSAIRKIGLACDYKDVPETIPFKEIKNMVNEFHAELHVIYVREPSESSLSPDTVEESGWLQEMLYEIKPKYHFISNNNIEEGIEEFTKSNNLDLLIVVPKKHNLLHKMFKKSHSKQLVLHAHVPVMAVHE